MTQDSKTVPITRDRVEDTSSDIKASKKPKTSENLSFDFDPFCRRAFSISCPAVTD